MKPPARNDRTAGIEMSPAMQATTLERSGAVLECFMVPWDSEIFGFPVAQIASIDLGDGSQADELLGEFDRWCADRDVQLVSCRLDHLQLRESMALEEHGFRFVETVYGPRLDRLDAIDHPRHEIQVTTAMPSDLPSIQEIAYSAFTTGRFLLDWRLSPELSKRRYASWVQTSFYAPRQTILKAEVDGDLLGFFIAEPLPDGSVYWHLTAVAPKWQGQGMGLSLWQTMLHRHRAEGATAVETTISGHNVAVMNLYGRLGFRFGSAQMTFHWRREPAPASPS